MAETGYYRHGKDTTLVPSAHHIGGLISADNGALTTVQIVPNRIYATPLILTRSCTIDGVYHKVNAAASGTYAQMGVYTVECLQCPIPGRIIAQDSLGALRGYVSQVCSLGTVVMSAPQSYSIGSRRMFWLAALWTSSANVTGVAVANAWAFFGYDTVSLSIPYTHLVASWAGSDTLPNTYPPVWTAVPSIMPAVSVRVVG